MILSDRTYDMQHFRAFVLLSDLSLTCPSCPPEICVEVLAGHRGFVGGG